MKFTPNSIKNQEFNKTLRGYDADEVRAFLEQMANHVEELNGKIASLEQENDKKNSRIEEFNKIEKSLHHTLIDARESSSKAIETTRKKIEQMVKEAEQKSSELLSGAKKEAEFVKNSVAHLREENKLLTAKLKAMVNTQSRMIDLYFSDQENEKISRDNPEKNINIDDILEKLT